MALLIVFMTLYLLKFNDYLQLEDKAQDSEDLIKHLQNENNWIKDQYLITIYIYVYIYVDI